MYTAFRIHSRTSVSHFTNNQHRIYSYVFTGSVLGFPRSTQEFIYFNRTDVQDAIHAPHIDWMSCTNGDVYINATTGRPGSDTSIPSTLSVLPNVIEKSERTIIVHGLAVSSYRTWDFCSLWTMIAGLHLDCRRHANRNPVSSNHKTLVLGLHPFQKHDLEWCARLP